MVSNLFTHILTVFSIEIENTECYLVFVSGVIISMYYL